MKSNKTFLKTISITLIAGFLAHDLAWAAPAAAEFLSASGITSKNPYSIRVPEQWGQTHEAFRGAKGRLLIHIQDAHTNFSAQSNIANIIQEMIQKHDVSTVFLEGGTKDDSLTFLRPLAPVKERERVALKYMRSGELNGAEYLNLATDHPMTLFGVEERGLYEKNLRSYADVASRREQALRYLDEIEKRAGRLKGRLYPPSVQALDAFIASFEKKDKSFTEYYDRLSSEARQAGVNLLGYPHFLSLEELKKNEEKIDFKQANAEQTELFRTLAAQGLSGIKPETASKVKAGSQRTAQELLDSAIASGTDVSKYSQLSAYAAYLKQYAAMDLETLLMETRRIEREVFERLLTSSDARLLFEATRVTRNLRTLLTLQATKDDFFDHIDQRADEHSRIVWMLGFINRKLMDSGNDAEVLPYESILEEAIPQIEDFYRTTEERDRVMVRRALEKMEKDDLKTAVLMTGGYHTPNLKEILRKENVSYVVVSPNVKEETNLKRYEKLLLSQLKEIPDAKTLGTGTVSPAKNIAFVFAERAGTILELQKSLTSEKAMTGKQVFGARLGNEDDSGYEQRSIDLIVGLSKKAYSNTKDLKAVLKQFVGRGRSLLNTTFEKIRYLGAASSVVNKYVEELDSLEKTALQILSEPLDAERFENLNELIKEIDHTVIDGSKRIQETKGTAFGARMSSETPRGAKEGPGMDRRSFLGISTKVFLSVFSAPFLGILQVCSKPTEPPVPTPSPMINVDSAVQWMIGQINSSTKLISSYDNRLPATDPSFGVTWSYNQGQAIESLVAAGDLSRAILLADGLLTVQGSVDGLWRNAYITATAAVANNLSEQSLRGTGPNVVVGNALLSIYERTGDARYLNAARRLGTGLDVYFRNKGSYGFFTAGEAAIWASTEENLRAMAFLSRLSQTSVAVPGDAQNAGLIAQWVRTKMFAGDHYWVGLSRVDTEVIDTTDNYSTDVQFLAVVMAQRSGLNPALFSGGMDWLLARKTFLNNNSSLPGIPRSLTAGGVWSEGTAGMALALQLLARDTERALFMKTLAMMQKAGFNGAFSSSIGGTPGYPGNFDYPSVEATAAAVVAELKKPAYYARVNQAVTAGTGARLSLIRVGAAVVIFAILTALEWALSGTYRAHPLKVIITVMMSGVLANGIVKQDKTDSGARMAGKRYSVEELGLVLSGMLDQAHRFHIGDRFNKKVQPYNPATPVLMWDGHSFTYAEIQDKERSPLNKILASPDRKIVRFVVDDRSEAGFVTLHSDPQHLLDRVVPLNQLPDTLEEAFETAIKIVAEPQVILNGFASALFEAKAQGAWDSEEGRKFIIDEILDEYRETPPEFQVHLQLSRFGEIKITDKYIESKLNVERFNTTLDNSLNLNSLYEPYNYKREMLDLLQKQLSEMDPEAALETLEQLIGDIGISAKRAHEAWKTRNQELGDYSKRIILHEGDTHRLIRNNTYQQRLDRKEKFKSHIAASDEEFLRALMNKTEEEYRDLRNTLLSETIKEAETLRFYSNLKDALLAIQTQAGARLAAVSPRMKGWKGIKDPDNKRAGFRRDAPSYSAFRTSVNITILKRFRKAFLADLLEAVKEYDQDPHWRRRASYGMAELLSEEDGNIEDQLERAGFFSETSKPFSDLKAIWDMSDNPALAKSISQELLDDFEHGDITADGLKDLRIKNLSLKALRAVLPVVTGQVASVGLRPIIIGLVISLLAIKAEKRINPEITIVEWVVGLVLLLGFVKPIVYPLARWSENLQRMHNRRTLRYYVSGETHKSARQRLNFTEKAFNETVEIFDAEGRSLLKAVKKAMQGEFSSLDHADILSLGITLMEAKVTVKSISAGDVAVAMLTEAAQRKRATFLPKTEGLHEPGLTKKIQNSKRLGALIDAIIPQLTERRLWRQSRTDDLDAKLNVIAQERLRMKSGNDPESIDWVTDSAHLKQMQPEGRKALILSYFAGVMHRLDRLTKITNGGIYAIRVHRMTERLREKLGAFAGNEKFYGLFKEDIDAMTVLLASLQAEAAPNIQSAMETTPIENPVGARLGEIDKELEARVREQLFIDITGITASSTAAALYQSGILGVLAVAYDADPSSTVGMEAITAHAKLKMGGANDGYLHGALAAMESEGYLVRDIPAPDIRNPHGYLDTMRFKLTEKGRVVVAELTPLYMKVSETVPVLKRMQEYLFSSKSSGPPFSDADDARFEDLLKEMTDVIPLGDSSSEARKEAYRQVYNHIEGTVVGPIMIEIQRRLIEPKIISKDKTFSIKSLPGNTERLSIAFRYLEKRGSVTMDGDNVSFTPVGLIAFSEGKVGGYGVPTSYNQTYELPVNPELGLSVLNTLLFGKKEDLQKVRDWNYRTGVERLVDRDTNIWGSEFAHKTYKKSLQKALLAMFNLPIEQQPKFVAGMGIGTGWFEEFAYQMMLNGENGEGTVRSRHLTTHPFIVLAADYNPVAIETTKKTYQNASIPYHAVWQADIRYLADFKKSVDQQLAALQKAHPELYPQQRLSSSDGFFETLMLIHNRPFVYPDKMNGPDINNEELEKLIQNPTEVFVDTEGNAISVVDYVKNLYKHFNGWKDLGHFGLLTLELYSVDPKEAAKRMGKSLNTSYMHSHVLSNQYLGTRERVLAVAQAAGLRSLEAIREDIPKAPITAVSTDWYVPAEREEEFKTLVAAARPSGEAGARLTSEEITAVNNEIRSAYEEYSEIDDALSERALDLFKNRDWRRVDKDQRARILLYSSAVNKISAHIKKILGEQLFDEALWKQLKKEYVSKLSGVYDYDHSQEFFKDVRRVIFSEKKDALLPESEDDDLSLKTADTPALAEPIYREHPISYHDEEWVLPIFKDLPFRLNENNLKTAVRQAAYHLEQRFGTELEGAEMQVLSNVFFLNQGAFLIGRIVSKDEKVQKPVVFSFVNLDEKGIRLHAVLTQERRVHDLFASRRSNFRIPGIRQNYRETYRFLQSIMRYRDKAEIYAALGYNQPGKVIFLKYLRSFMKAMNPMFAETPGTKGTVMMVMYLEGVRYVFKIIRDYSKKFKNKEGELISDFKEYVKDKYRMTRERDRLGRELNSWHLRDVPFQASQFLEETLKVLKEEFGQRPDSNVSFQGDRILFKDIYVQRLVTPLDVFFLNRDIPLTDMMEAMRDLHSCIKELALGGIYLGDMAVKQFGITPDKRVVSYDNDDKQHLEDLGFIDMDDQVRRMAHDSDSANQKIDIMRERYRRPDYMSEPPIEILIPEYEFMYIRGFAFILIKEARETGDKDLFKTAVAVWDLFENDLEKADWWIETQRKLVTEKHFPHLYPYPQSVYLFQPEPEDRASRPLLSPVEQQVVVQIASSFDDMWNQHKRLTDRAAENFEKGDWNRVLQDADARMRLYSVHLTKVAPGVDTILAAQSVDEEVWTRMKDDFLAGASDRYKQDLMLTYFYSVMRRVFSSKGLTVQYSDDGLSDRRERSRYRRLYNEIGMDATGAEGLVTQIFNKYSFGSARFEDLSRDITVSAKVIIGGLDTENIEHVEMLKPIFYRNKGAYLVGKVVMKDETSRPIVFALTHTELGIQVDAVLLSEKEVNSIFSNTRANFFVKTESYRELTDFLETILPHRGRASLYSVIGFIHPGKVELIKSLYRLLEDNDKEMFVDTDGIKGMALATFTLPSYPYVFKIVRDFSQKDSFKGKLHVIQQHSRVHMQDRVGRMLDPITFHNLKLRRSLFPEAILQELQNTTPSSVEITDEFVILKHAYLQRKVVPLNVYLFDEKVSAVEKEKVLIDLGNLIKDLIAADVFVGDYALKNFGVTHFGKVVLYDFDELETIQEHAIQLLPKLENWYDRMEDYTHPDIFYPEDTMYWLVPNQFQEKFKEVHADLFEPAYWDTAKNRLKAGEIIDFYPYSQDRRLSHLFPEFYQGARLAANRQTDPENYLLIRAGESQDLLAEKRGADEMSMTVLRLHENLSSIHAIRKKEGEEVEWLLEDRKQGLVRELKKTIASIGVDVFEMEGATFNHYRLANKKMADARRQVAGQIQKAFLEKRTADLRSLNLEAVRLNRIILTLQLLMVEKILTGKTKIPQPAMIRNAALWTLEGAWISANHLSEELGFRNARIEASRKRKYLQTALDSEKRIYQFGRKTYEFSEADAGKSGEVVIGTTRWMNLASILSGKKSAALDVRQNRLQAAYDKIHLVRGQFLVSQRGRTQRMIVQDYSRMASALKEVMDEIKRMLSAGLSLQETKETRQALSQKLEELSKDIQYPKVRVATTVRHTDTGTAVRAQFNIIDRIRDEAGLLIGQKEFLKHYRNQLLSEVTRQKEGFNVKVFSRSMKQRIVYGLGMIKEWAAGGNIHEKQQIADLMPEVLVKIENGDYGAAAKSLGIFISFIENRERTLDSEVKGAQDMLETLLHAKEVADPTAALRTKVIHIAKDMEGLEKFAGIGLRSRIPGFRQTLKDWSSRTPLTNDIKARKAVMAMFSISGYQRTSVPIRKLHARFEEIKNETDKFFGPLPSSGARLAASNENADNFKIILKQATFGSWGALRPLGHIFQSLDIRQKKEVLKILIKNAKADRGDALWALGLAFAFIEDAGQRDTVYSLLMDKGLAGVDGALRGLGLAYASLDGAKQNIVFRFLSRDENAENKDALFGLGLAYKALNETYREEAYEILKKQAEAGNGFALWGLGFAFSSFAEAGQQDEIFELFKKTAKNNGNWGALRSLGLIHSLLSPEQRKESYKILLEGVNAGDGDAFWGFGLAYATFEQDKKIVVHKKLIAEARDGNWGAVIGLGESYVSLDAAQQKEAEALFKQKATKGHWDSLWALGLSAQGARLADKAIFKEPGFDEKTLTGMSYETLFTSEVIDSEEQITRVLEAIKQALEKDAGPDWRKENWNLVYEMILNSVSGDFRAKNTPRVKVKAGLSADKHFIKFEIFQNKFSDDDWKNIVASSALSPEELSNDAWRREQGLVQQPRGGSGWATFVDHSRRQPTLLIYDRNPNSTDPTTAIYISLNGKGARLGSAKLGGEDAWVKEHITPDELPSDIEEYLNSARERVIRTNVTEEKGVRAPIEVSVRLFMPEKKAEEVEEFVYTLNRKDTIGKVAKELIEQVRAVPGWDNQWEYRLTATHHRVNLAFIGKSGARLAEENVIEVDREGQFVPDGKPILLIAEDDASLRTLYLIYLKSLLKNIPFSDVQVVLTERLDHAFTAFDIALQSGNLRFVITDKQYPASESEMLYQGKESGTALYELVKSKQIPIIMFSSGVQPSEVLDEEFSSKGGGLKNVMPRIELALSGARLTEKTVVSSQNTVSSPQSPDNEIASFGVRLVSALKPKTDLSVPVLWRNVSAAAVTMFNIKLAYAGAFEVNAISIEDLSKPFEGPSLYRGVINPKQIVREQGVSPSKQAGGVLSASDAVSEEKMKFNSIQAAMPVDTFEQTHAVDLEVPVNLYDKNEKLDLGLNQMRFIKDLFKRSATHVYLTGIEKLDTTQLAGVTAIAAKYPDFVSIGSAPIKEGRVTVRLVNTDDKDLVIPDGVFQLPVEPEKQGSFLGRRVLYLAKAMGLSLAKNGKFDPVSLAAGDIQDSFEMAYNEDAVVRATKEIIRDIAIHKAEWSVLVQHRILPALREVINEIGVLANLRRTILQSA